MRVVAAYVVSFVVAGSLSAQSPAVATVSGIVYDSLLTNAPLAGAEVLLSGVSRRIVTDARGRFSVDGVALGTHDITFSSTRLDSLGIGIPIWRIDVSATGFPRLVLATPSAAVVHRTVCSTKDTTTALVVGRVRDAATGQPLVGARISAAWSDWIWKQGMVRQDRAVVAEADGFGAYRLCGVPNDITTALRATSASHSSGVIAASIDGKQLAFWNLSVSTSDSLVTANAADSTSVPRFVGTARLAGSVTANHRPVRDARVQVLGASVHALTDTAGRFAMVGLPGGSQTIQVLALGAAPSRTLVELTPGGSAEVNVSIDPSAVALAPISVIAERTRVARTGFEERRKNGFGHFLTSEDIERSHPFDTSDLFRTVPGMTVSRAGFSTVVGFARGQGFGADYRPCAAALFVDGVHVMMDETMSIDDWVRPGQIESIETYNGLAGVPPFARGLKPYCGVIVIWTKSALAR
jgi:hypothetical protein